jgi:hypothetical protein
MEFVGYEFLYLVNLETQIEIYSDYVSGSVVLKIVKWNVEIRTVCVALGIYIVIFTVI